MLSQDESVKSIRTIDMDALLAPIAGGNPSGESLRFAATYDAIQQARRADDNLNQGDWKRETKVADWAAVTKVTAQALAAKTKDIQIAAWLTEALVKQHGFAGLRDGLELIGELIRRFWDTLYPEPEDGDFEVRAAVIEWVNSRLPIAIAEIAATAAVDGPAYSFLRHHESRAVEEAGKRSKEALQSAIAEGKMTAEQFDKAVAAGSREFYEKLSTEISQAAAQCESLATIVDEKFGRDAPGLVDVKQTLEDCESLIESIVRNKRELEPDPPAVAPLANGVGPPSQADPPIEEDLARNSAAVEPRRASDPPRPRTVALGGSNGGSALRDRTEALRQLQMIAEFFRRTEPHSPVAYLVQRAVRWGEMPLEKWLTDVITDEGVLTRIRETLGIKDSGGEGA